MKNELRETRRKCRELENEVKEMREGKRRRGEPRRRGEKVRT
jgi:hypothetical protein